MPLLRTLQGDSKAMPRFRRLRLGAPVRQRPGRRGFYRARIEGDVVLPLDNQASGAVTSMAWAEALISIDADSEGSAAGETVEVLLVDEL
jgi:molybdopterin biosynthesis enzyme